MGSTAFSEKNGGIIWTISLHYSSKTKCYRQILAGVCDGGYINE
jgi:hypothetical protein